MIAWLWAGFVVFVLVMLTLDLFVVNRKPHVINAREALAWTGVCIALALLFNVAVYFIYAHDWLGIGTQFATQHAPGLSSETMEIGPKLGKRAATEFFAGWLVEYSLSMDNIFVIALIFGHFKVPQQYQHRLLFWGIMGALVLRGIMILAGAALVQNFEWILYIFGALLIFTGFKLVAQKHEDFDPEHGFVLRIARRLLPISGSEHGARFTTRVDGRFRFTPLFIVLLVVETTDVVFAVDSIPAIFGITRDPFLVFTSNVFAIMGLRSLYFALASLMNKFRFIKFSLAFILVFVGVKMMLEGVHHLRPIAGKMFKELPSWLGWLPSDPVHINPVVSLSIIAGALVIGVGTSMIVAEEKKKSEPADPPKLDQEPTE